MNEFIEKIKKDHKNLHELVLAVQKECSTMKESITRDSLKITDVPIGYQLSLFGLIGLVVYNEDQFGYSSHVMDIIWYKNKTFVDYENGEEIEIVKFSELSEESIFQQSLIMNQRSQYYYLLYCMCLENNTPHFKANMSQLPILHKEYFEKK